MVPYRSALAAAAALCLLGSLTATPALAQAYVDDDSPGDPGPNDPAISDPQEDGSRAHPFDSIREALDSLPNPCHLIIEPGIYHEDLSMPDLGCVMTGSGRAVTRIRSVSGLLVDGAVGSGDPSLPANVLISDLTLEGGEIAVLAGPGQTGVTLLDAALLGADLRVHACCAVAQERVRVELSSVELAGSSIIIEAQGTPIDLSLDSAVMAGGAVRLQASGVHTESDLTGLMAPDTTIEMQRSAGGNQTVLLRDSTVAALDTRSVDYSASATVENVRFTGAGILTDHGEGHLDVTVVNGTFEQGGVSIRSRPDIDTASGTVVTIHGSVFQHDGVSLTETITSINDVHVTLNIDSSLFRRQGVSITVDHGMLEGDVVGRLDLSLTNNIFQSSPGGVGLSYHLADPGPGTAHADLRAAIVNNTFHGNTTGLAIATTPHLTGRDILATVIRNNVIAAGVTGVEILGTDDHVFTIDGNDVFGHTGGDYAGDVPDPTGLDGNISEDPRFVSASMGDYRLMVSSPCVDNGVPGPDVPATDHAGSARPQDGDGDGVAVVDIGAFEFIRIDADGDGWYAGEDCDDARPAINPGTFDIPGDTVDEDCDGAAICSPAEGWRTHGAFVLCVTRVATGLFEAGLISARQRENLIEEAAQSSVGGKKNDARRNRPGQMEP